MNKKVLGVYNSTDDVIFAIEEFRNEGYSVNELSIIANTRDVPSSIQYETGVTTEELSGTNNTRTPKNTGLLSSLVSSLMVNTKTDEDETSYFDHLVGLGFDEGAAREYEEDINSGRILLLSDSGAENTGTSVGAFTGTTALEQTGLDADTLGTDKERSLKLREEQLDVSKESVQTGEVEVHKDVVEEQKTVHVPVTHEEVYVERRDVDDATADTTTPIGDDETIRVPI